MSPYTAVVADDHTLMRQALAHFLASTGEFTVIGEAGDGLEAAQITLRLRPDVVLMDLGMPRLGGIGATARVLQEWPAARVLAVTTFAAPEAVVPMLRAGAGGYVLKDASPEELVAAALAVVEGRSVLSPAVLDAVVREVRTGDGPADPRLGAEADRVRSELTEGETQVVALLGEGLGNAEIARELGVTEATVKGRLTRVMTKMGVLSRVQVVVRACELGLVTPRLR
ncbi:response regulator [Arsenicicoccus dermatophilus]|uniref:response regulator n=1 Tax=Arsenicicoccus dermatophilus TaxID=1076331 RepID=UPI003916D382